MNTQEIWNMPAGREMDVLIAETFGLVKNAGSPLELILPFSTNLLAAWEVVEKLSGEWDIALLNNQGFLIQGMTYGVRLEAVDKNSRTQAILALGETMPIAICRAALLTKDRPA